MEADIGNPIDFNKEEHIQDYNPIKTMIITNNRH